MKTDFYQKHLNQVSRSFAFCIQQLRPEVRNWVGLSYILCRLIDTVEDAPWPNPHKQVLAYEMFQNFLKQTPTSESMQKWRELFPESLPLGEKDLLADAEIFLGDLHALTPSVRTVLQQQISNMTKGMQYFSDNFKSSGRLQLNSIYEMNQYCFFVAGVVGELLTDVFAFAESEFQPNHQTYVRGFHFGLFLQKINILKDQLQDLQEGRDFVWSRAQLRASVSRHAEEALQYILSIPVRSRDLRLFCAWSLFLGLASLPYIDESWQKQKMHKISRLETTWLLNKIKINIDSNDFLLKLFSDSKKQLLKNDSQVEKYSGDYWFEKIYEGRLQRLDLADLGLLSAEA